MAKIFVLHKLGFFIVKRIYVGVKIQFLNLQYTWKKTLVTIVIGHTFVMLSKLTPPI